MSEPRPAPTMRSLALEAGVSAMTVSLALRNSDQISATIRRRIQELAEARGYRPDPTVNRLMHHLRTRRLQRQQATIACLAPPASHLPGWNYYYSEMMRGIESRAHALGFAIDRVVPDETESPAQLNRLLLSRGITGLILMPRLSSGTLPFALDWERFSVVAATSSIESPRFHTVIPNHYDNLLDAGRRLLELGYQRIGLAIPSDNDRRVHHRWTGALAWHRAQNPAAFVPSLVTKGALTPDLLRAWVAREKPEVVIIHPIDDEVETLRALPRAQRPKIVTMAPAAGSFAYLDQVPATVGEVAVSIVAGLMATNTTGVPENPHYTLVNGVWRKTGRRAGGNIALGSGRKF